MASSGSNGRVAASHNWKWALPLLALGTGVVVFFGVQFANTVQRETALSAARTYSKTVTAVRDQYAATMTGSTRESSTVMGHGSEDPPVAYTILSDVSEKLPGLGHGRFRVFSDYPWPNRESGGPHDDLERELLQRIVANGEKEVVVERTKQEARTLVFAEPIVMRERCINCHNTHAETPRQGWRVGDVRGVQLAEVELPAMPILPTAATASSVLTLAVLVAVALFVVWLLAMRLRSIEARSERYQFQNQVADSLADGLICLRRDGTITEFNRSAEALFGYSREEAIGQPVTILMNSENATRHVEGFQRFFATGGVGRNPPGQPVEVSGVAKSGEQIPVSMLVSLVHGCEEPQVVGTLRDLRPTIRHRRVSSFLQATFESIDQGVTIYDENLQLVAWNERYKELDTGIDPKFLAYGTSLFDLYRETATRGVFGPGDPEELARLRIEAIRNGPLIATETLTPSTGSVIRINRFRLPSGGIVATFRDITEERRIEEELRHSQKMEAVGRLAGGIAHDLNNVLAVILGNTEMLLDESRSESDKRTFRTVMDAARRGSQVTHRMLALSRKQPLQPGVVKLHDLLESLALILQQTIGENVRLAMNTPATLWECTIDRAQLESTLINLAANARDSMCEGGGELRFESSNVSVGESEAADLGVKAGEFVQIVVTDTGVGMSEEVLEHAFDPFYTTKDLGKGTGLGLSMAYGFVRQSNGAILIESDSGGTSVRILLPRSESTPKELPPVLNDTGPISEDSERVVLLVEDEDNVRFTVTQQIELLGFKVIAKSDGVQAQEVLQSDEHIDVVLTDLVLPGPHDGTKVAEFARESAVEVPTIFMSGYSEEVFGRTGQLGGEQLLVKPFDLGRLRDALRSAVGNGLR